MIVCTWCGGTRVWAGSASEPACPGCNGKGEVLDTASQQLLDGMIEDEQARLDEVLGPDGDDPEPGFGAYYDEGRHDAPEETET